MAFLSNLTDENDNLLGFSLSELRNDTFLGLLDFFWAVKFEYG
jgi:hypothetical protein